MRPRYLSAVALSLALCAGSAFAADLPSRKAPTYFPPPPPPPLWTGFYVGLNAGYAGSGSTGASNVAYPIIDTIPAILGSPLGATRFANTGIASVDQSGFIGGGQIGYNWQFADKFVAGIEADIQGSTIRGSANYWGVSSFLDTTPPPWRYTTAGFGNVAAGIDYIGTVRGRLGYLFTPTLLVYGTGGLAYGDVHASASHGLTPLTIADAATGVLLGVFSPFSGAGRFLDTRVGWTAGGGLEWLFAPNWSVKAEALYYDLGTITFPSSPVGLIDVDGTVGRIGELSIANVVSTSMRFDGVIARAGVNYHFNWGAPVVAKF